MPSNPAFSAASSLSGFSVQIHLAIQYLCAPEVATVQFEGDDDVASTTLEGVQWAAQVKYHGSSHSMGPKDPELWKTLRIWMGLAKRPVQQRPGKYRLITTCYASNPKLQIAYKDGRHASEDSLLEAFLLDTAKSGSTDTDVQETMAAWKNADGSLRMDIISRMSFVQSDASFTVIREETLDKLAGLVHAEPGQLSYLEDLLQRIAMEILDGLGHQASPILSKQGAMIHWGQIGFGHAAGTPAPIHGATSFATPTSWDSGAPRFIRQLQAVGAPDVLLEDAALNFLRSDAERIRIRRLPVGKTYIDQQEEELLMIWRQIRAMAIPNPSVTEEALGLQVFSKCCERESHMGTRPCHVHEHQGGLHALADLPSSNPRGLGWHPKYETTVP